MVRDKTQIHQSKYGETFFRKTRNEMVRAWESLAYEAERDKDYRLAHNYFQQAEHYKRLA